MLTTDLPKSKLSILRDALDVALREEQRVAEGAVALPKEIAHTLVAAGFLGEDGGWQAGRQPIRRRGERIYVMSTGGAEYRQDVWPETDSLLEILDAASPGRLLDMGTGTGIVAIEAAARGHSVVATDLYENTLNLARFNSRLNRTEGIDFRQGHLFEPAQHEKFDLILTAPHYTRLADQLRLESLRTGLSLIADGGRLVLATFLEWEGGDDAPLPVVETILRPMVERGASVTVRPIYSPLKKNWFTRVETQAPLRGLVSRHRFVIIIEPSGGRLSVERPPVRQQLNEVFVPLSRLRTNGEREAAARGRAVLDSSADVAKLEDLLKGMAGGFLTLSGGIPRALHDACRLGAGTCVSPDDHAGAAGAILDLAGNVRPCSAGGVIGRVDDTMATLLDRQRRLSAETALRRGCATCEARAWCSRCLYPGPLSERHYCAIMRAAGPELPQLHRLLQILPTLDADMQRLQLKLRRTPALLAARGRPYTTAAAHPDEALARTVAERLARVQCWILLIDDARFALVTRHGETDWIEYVERSTAAIAELLLDGSGAADLAQHAEAEQLAPDQPRQILSWLGAC